MKFKTGDLIRGNSDSWRHYGITDDHCLLQVVSEKEEKIDVILLRSDRRCHRGYEYEYFKDLCKKDFHIATGKDLLKFNLKREIHEEYNTFQIQLYKKCQENHEKGLLLNEDV